VVGGEKRRFVGAAGSIGGVFISVGALSVSVSIVAKLLACCRSWSRLSPRPRNREQHEHRPGVETHRPGLCWHGSAGSVHAPPTTGSNCGGGYSRWANFKAALTQQSGTTDPLKTATESSGG